ncbi:hypothetical protein KK425_08895 [Clostridioides difficile]|nr:hypothetical protein [Clostridioides difficile]
MPSKSLSFNSAALPPIKVTILLNTSVADVLSSPNFSLIFPIPSPIFDLMSLYMLLLRLMKLVTRLMLSR